MKKQFSKKQHRTKHSQNTIRLRWLLLGVFLIALFCGAYFISVKKSASMTAFYSKATTWVSEKRSHFAKKVAHIKQITTVQNEVEPQIHFEFYTALPNMQVAGSERVAKKSPKLEAANTKIADPNELEQEISDSMPQKKREKL